MSNEIEKGLANMMAFWEYSVAQQTLETAIEDSEFIVAEVDKVYKSFFAEMLRVLESISYDANENYTPSGILAGTTWKPLSEVWMGVKANYNNKKALPFYHGVSRFRKTGGRPFVDYIRGLAANQNSADRFFGHPSVSYTVSKAGRSFTINSKKGLSEFSKIGPTQAERPFSKAERKKEYTIRTTILSFPKLVDKVFREFEIVDAMIKSPGSGASPYKQLVKINGQKGFLKSSRKEVERPIRPIITPIILWQLKRIQNLLVTA